MKKILLTLILGIFLISLASATLLGTFKQNQDVNLIQTCSDCTYNKITSIQKPDGTILTFNVNMDKDDTYYNWTLNGTYTDQIGIYLVNGVGDLVMLDTIWAYDFEITPTGEYEKFTRTSVPILIFLMLLGFTFIGLGMGLKIPPLGFIGSILLILAGMYVMIYGFGNMTNLYTRGVAISLLGLGFIFIVSSAYEWFAWGEEG